MNANERWLVQQTREKMEQDARKRCYDSFDEYLKDYPEAEYLRKWVGDGILIPTYEGPNLPGNYYTVSIHQRNAFGRKPDGSVDFRNRTDEVETWVILNDIDDGTCRKRVANLEEATQELENLKALAPFYYWSLREFGYEDFN